MNGKMKQNKIKEGGEREGGITRNSVKELKWGNSGRFCNAETTGPPHYTNII
jgi:hypothetical protein